MNYNLAYYTYFVSLAYASFFGIYRFKKLDIASRILSVLVCSALINESIGFYLSIKLGSNMALYAIYCLIEYGMLCLYFNKIIDVFIKRNIGIYIGIGGIIFGILNLVFIQNLDSLNSYFLFFEGLMVIGMSLFACTRLLLKNDVPYLFRYPHFWFLCILVFFWSITFLNWGLYDYVNLKLKKTAWEINFSLQIICIITYFCLGTVFLLYPKMQTNYE